MHFCLIRSREKTCRNVYSYIIVGKITGLMRLGRQMQNVAPKAKSSLARLL